MNEARTWWMLFTILPALLLTSLSLVGNDVPWMAYRKRPTDDPNDERSTWPDDITITSNILDQTIRYCPDDMLTPCITADLEADCQITSFRMKALLISGLVCMVFAVLVTIGRSIKDTPDGKQTQIFAVFLSWGFVLSAIGIFFKWCPTRFKTNPSGGIPVELYADRGFWVAMGAAIALLHALWKSVWIDVQTPLAQPVVQDQRNMEAGQGEGQQQQQQEPFVCSFPNMISTVETLGKIVSSTLAFALVMFYVVKLYGYGGWAQYYLFLWAVFETLVYLTANVLVLKRLASQFDKQALILKVLQFLSQALSFAAVGGMLLEYYVADATAATKCLRAAMILFWLIPLFCFIASKFFDDPVGTAMVGFGACLLASFGISIYALVFTGKTIDSIAEDNRVDDDGHMRYILFIVGKSIWILLELVKVIIRVVWNNKMEEFVNLIHLRLLYAILDAWSWVITDPNLKNRWEELGRNIDAELNRMARLIF